MSVALEQLVTSSLSADFEFHVLNTAKFRTLSGAGTLSPAKLVGDLDLLRQLQRHLRGKAVSLVYIAVGQTRLGMIRDSLLIRMSKRYGAPVVVHLHGSMWRHQLERLPAWERHFISEAYRMVDIAVVLSGRLRWIFNGIIDPHRLAVVANGLPDIPCSCIRPASATKPPDACARILFLSNLQAEKGLFDLLNALGRLKEQRRSFLATLAGAWPDESTKAYAVHLINTNNLVNAVALPGVITGQRKLQALAAADVFVVPFAQQEGQPIVILEAMRSALPVVTTGMGCIPDMIQHAESGFLLRPGCPTDIAYHLSILLDNPEQAARMGQRARQEYLRSYTLDAHVRRMHYVFGWAIGQGPSSCLP